MSKLEKGSEAAKEHMRKVREGRKLKNNYEKMKGHENLVMTNTAKITVPKTLLHIDDKGEQKIIKTVTKSGNLTRRDKKPVIDIEPLTNNTLRVIQGKTKAERSRNILKGIHNSTINRHDEMEKAFLEGMNNINWRLKKDREKYWEMFKHKNKVDQDVKTRIDEKYIKGSWDHDWFRKILFDGDIGDIHYAPVPRHKQAERKKREEDEKKRLEKLKTIKDTGKPNRKHDPDAMHYS
jgi:hypothetical protein